MIDPGTEKWDEELIRDIFNPVDVNRILQIPLNYSSFEDFVAWNGSSSGFFSVRSAYHCEWNHEFRNTNHLVGPAAPNIVWSILWKLRIPGKIKIFCWRALHGILPLKSILTNRHVGSADHCPMICSQGPEDVMHLLFGCARAKELWRLLGLSQIISEATTEDRFGSIVLEHLLRLPESSMPKMISVELKEGISTTCWYLWWMRRQQTHHSKT